MLAFGSQTFSAVIISPFDWATVSVGQISKATVARTANTCAMMVPLCNDVTVVYFCWRGFSSIHGTGCSSVGTNFKRDKSHTIGSFR